MADSAPSGSSPKEDNSREQHKEDDETRDARRELNKSSLSDRLPASAAAGAEQESGTVSTPPLESSDAQNNDSADQILSPKKKRAHDQLDEGKAVQDDDARSVASTDSAKDRASRDEPEKKRARDGETSNNESDNGNEAESKSLAIEEGTKSTKPKQPETSASAFAASGFGKLASSSSPFASLGGSTASGFGASSANSLTSFASPQKPTDSQPAAAPKMSFGGGAGASPFAGLSTGANGFGSSFKSGTAANSGGFGSALPAAKPLGSFATPGSKPLSSSKVAKPFGAPESDVESDEEGDEEGSGSQADEDRAASPEKETEDKKKPKPHKIEVNDGESGETTIVSVRAKVFHHDQAWKERGSGMLKVNVPRACVDFDKSGMPISGSFDASGLELENENDGESNSKGHRLARLLLRQDQTHRVILNTALLPTMKFQETASLKSNGIMFTAFEGDEAKPVIINLKMTAANAKVLMNEINMIQRELQSN